LNAVTGYADHEIAARMSWLEYTYPSYAFPGQAANAAQIRDVIVAVVADDGQPALGRLEGWQPDP
jgi:hypothetical protein